MYFTINTLDKTDNLKAVYLIEDGWWYLNYDKSCMFGYGEEWEDWKIWKKIVINRKISLIMSKNISFSKR